MVDSALVGLAAHSGGSGDCGVVGGFIADGLPFGFESPDQVLEGLFFPTKPTLRNWTTIFQNVPLALYIGDSSIAAISGSLITLVITIPAVYALSRIRIGQRFLPGIVLGSYIAPPMVPLIPLFFLAKWSGLIHTLPGLIICYGLLNIPVALWLLTGFIERIPEEIEEAAAIDGANVFRTLCQFISPASNLQTDRRTKRLFV